jgi:hypothetical protein
MIFPLCPNGLRLLDRFGFFLNFCPLKQFSSTLCGLTLRMLDIFARNSGQEFEHKGPDPVPLPLVMHRNNDLRVVGSGVVAIAADTQHSFASLEGHHPYDGHVIMIVEIEKLLHQFGRQIVQWGKVTVQNCSLRM